MARVAELEESLDALRIRFEQFFLGITRKPPVAERAALRSAILQLKSGLLRNTAVKFRVNMLHNRLLSYERLWDRTLREMENGTYRRDLFKARLHGARGAAGAGLRGARREGSGATAGGEAGSDLGGGRGEGGFPGAGVAGSAGGGQQEGPASRKAGGGAAGEDLDEARVRAIHAAYVAARRRCQESTEGITVEAVASALRKQVPQLLEKHRARAVDFQVVIENGKAVLKAIPR